MLPQLLPPLFHPFHFEFPHPSNLNSDFSRCSFRPSCFLSVAKQVALAAALVALPALSLELSLVTMDGGADAGVKQLTIAALLLCWLLDDENHLAVHLATYQSSYQSSCSCSYQVFTYRN